MSNILRDSSTAMEDKRPFSLARFQLFWWSVIVIGSYLLLFSIRDHFSILNATALVLLGISMASTGMASLIDSNDSNKDRHQNKVSVNFLTDVLSDENGVSIHRFQNFIFTIIFGIIFIYKVFETAHMPSFGQTELFLMGLSSAAYLTLKMGENKSAAPAKPATTDPPAGTNPPDTKPEG